MNTTKILDNVLKRAPLMVISGSFSDRNSGHGHSARFHRRPERPRKILADDRYGIIGPPWEAATLAEGMLKALQENTPPFDRIKTIDRFCAENAARAYLDFMGITTPQLGS